MANLYFETMEDKNNYIEKLKRLTIAKDEMLYDMIKDDECQNEKPKKVIYKSIRDITKYKGCDSCRFFAEGKGCQSKIIKTAEDVKNCINNDHKYWEGKDE